MRQTSSIHPASSPAVFAIRNHTHRYREHSMTFTVVCTPRGSLQVAVNLLRSSAHAFICCFHETLTTSGTGSGNFLPDSNIILSQVPSLTSTPKFQTYRLPLLQRELCMARKRWREICRGNLSTAAAMTSEDGRSSQYGQFRGEAAGLWNSDHCEVQCSVLLTPL